MHELSNKQINTITKITDLHSASLATEFTVERYMKCKGFRESCGQEKCEDVGQDIKMERNRDD